MKKTLRQCDVVVDTSRFESSHGRQPRGRGGWAFFLGDSRELKDVLWFHGLFADAKRQAVAAAVERGERRVVVGS